MKHKIRRVEVTWSDACVELHDRGLFSDEIHFRPETLVNIGYLAKTSKDTVVLAMSAHASKNERPGEPLYRDFMVIPRGMVRRIRTVR